MPELTLWDVANPPISYRDTPDGEGYRAYSARRDTLAAAEKQYLLGLSDVVRCEPSVRACLDGEHEVDHEEADDGNWMELCDAASAVTQAREGTLLMVAHWIERMGTEGSMSDLLDRIKGTPAVPCAQCVAWGRLVNNARCPRCSGTGHDPQEEATHG